MGLWIVLAATLAIALVLMLAREIQLKYVRPKLKVASARMLQKVGSLGRSISGLSRSTAGVDVEEQKITGFSK